MRNVHIGGAAAGTIFLAGPVATGAGISVSILANGLLGDPARIALGAVTGLTLFGGAAASFWTIARTNFRNWRKRTENEANGLLDRLEKADELRPPPAPWLRKLQLKFRP